MGQQRVVGLRDDLLTDGGAEIVRQFGVEQDQALGLGDLQPQDAQRIAEDHPPAGVHAGKSLGSGGQPHHHGGGHLDGHFHLVQIRELRLQFFGLFGGGEAEKVGVFLDIQRRDDLILGINAGVGGGTVVKVLDPEDGHLEQQVDRHERADGQHGQHSQHPQKAAAARAA